MLYQKQALRKIKNKVAKCIFFSYSGFGSVPRLNTQDHPGVDWRYNLLKIWIWKGVNLAFTQWGVESRAN